MRGKPETGATALNSFACLTVVFRITAARVLSGADKRSLGQTILNTAVSAVYQSFVFSEKNFDGSEDNLLFGDSQDSLSKSMNTNDEHMHYLNSSSDSGFSGFQEIGLPGLKLYKFFFFCHTFSLW